MGDISFGNVCLSSNQVDSLKDTIFSPFVSNGQYGYIIPLIAADGNDESLCFSDVTAYVTLKPSTMRNTHMAHRFGEIPYYKDSRGVHQLGGNWFEKMSDKDVSDVIWKSINTYLALTPSEQFRYKNMMEWRDKLQDVLKPLHPQLSQKRKLSDLSCSELADLGMKAYKLAGDQKVVILRAVAYLDLAGKYKHQVIPLLLQEGLSKTYLEPVLWLYDLKIADVEKIFAANSLPLKMARFFDYLPGFTNFYVDLIGKAAASGPVGQLDAANAISELIKGDHKHELVALLTKHSKSIDSKSAYRILEALNGHGAIPETVVRPIVFDAVKNGYVKASDVALKYYANDAIVEELFQRNMLSQSEKLKIYNQRYWNDSDVRERVFKTMLAGVSDKYDLVIAVMALRQTLSTSEKEFLKVFVSGIIKNKQDADVVDLFNFLNGFKVSHEAKSFVKSILKETCTSSEAMWVYGLLTNGTDSLKELSVEILGEILAPEMIKSGDLAQIYSFASLDSHSRVLPESFWNDFLTLVLKPKEDTSLDISYLNLICAHIKLATPEIKDAVGKVVMQHVNDENFTLNGGLCHSLGNKLYNASVAGIKKGDLGSARLLAAVLETLGSYPDLVSADTLYEHFFAKVLPLLASLPNLDHKTMGRLAEQGGGMLMKKIKQMPNVDYKKQIEALFKFVSPACSSGSKYRVWSDCFKENGYKNLLELWNAYVLKYGQPAR